MPSACAIFTASAYTLPSGTSEKPAPPEAVNLNARLSISMKLPRVMGEPGENFPPPVPLTTPVTYRYSTDLLAHA